MEHLARCSALLGQYSDEMGVHLDSEQLIQFQIYLEQLKIWNRSINLTSIKDDVEIVIKHFLDSLAGLAAEEMPVGARLLDVGTGAGFPGIPLKIARNDLNVTLVEPVQKKVSFLYSLIGQLQLRDVRVFYGTFENFCRGLGHGLKFDYVTTRALKRDVILHGEYDVLGSCGKTILYQTDPLSGAIPGCSIVRQHVFALPRGYGDRVVAVLCKS